MVAASSARRIPESPPPLVDEHRRELEGSGISAEVIAARGYYTARSPRDLPDAFPRWQRRPGLVVPGLSPSGAAHYQYKPKTPIRRKSGPGPKYETPHGAGVFLDVNPLMLEEVRTGTGELWITEGAKKVDALASWGVPAVGVTGVHAAAVKGSKGTVPLPCWRYVRLRGRTVIVAYDADAKTNASVQEGLRRLVAMLEGLGAVVLVIYVPAVGDDSKAGVDDYKAAGLTLEGLRRQARPFVPLDVGRERMRRDVKLATVVRACRRHLEEMPANGRAACSNRAVFRDLLRTGERSGKVRPEGLLVVRSSLDGALGSRISERAWWKAIERMEAAGELRRAKWGPKKDRPGAYLLTPSLGGSAERAHYRREATAREGQGGEEKEGAHGFPLSYGPDDRSVHETRGARAVPALRWPKVVHTWGRRNGSRVVVDSDYIARIGKQGEEIIRYLLEFGRTPETELLRKFGARTTRLRDFRRRRLKEPLEERGIISLESGAAQLTPAWRDALERERELREEIKDNRLQAEKVERRKLERREHFKRVRRGEVPKADPAPKREDLMGKQSVRETLKRHRPSWAREQVEAERQKVGRTAAVFLSDELAGVSGMRFQDLRQRWIERGGKTEDLTRAVRDPLSPFRFERDPVDEALYVYQADTPKQSHERPKPAPIAPLRTERKAENLKKPETEHPVPTPKKEPPKVNGVYVHPDDCECWLCEDSEAAPSYAGAPA